eukprot:4892117-Pyramimonas_sp.AAC.1
MSSNNNVVTACARVGPALEAGLRALSRRVSDGAAGASGGGAATSARSGNAGPAAGSAPRLGKFAFV